MLLYERYYNSSVSQWSVAVRESIEKCIAKHWGNSWQGAERHISRDLGSISIAWFTYEMLSGGPAQTHVGTGGGSSSDMPWGEKKNDDNMTSARRKR